MLDNKWKSWGISVIGPMHIKNDIPNQDSWMSRQYNWGNVIVVSDGLGSKPHSDFGSKIACKAVFEGAKIYQKKLDSKISDILRFIHAYWLVEITPFRASDCSATCLFAIQIEEILILGQLGDGIIIANDKANKKSIILNENKEDSFSNITHSLTEDFNLKHWQIRVLNINDYKSILLCTDGISDDLILGEEIEFSKSLSKEFCNMNKKERAHKLKRMLETWPVPMHSDDKTIACLYNLGEFNE